MEYNNNIIIIGKNVELIGQKLDLNQSKEKKKIENFWNINLFEIENNFSEVLGTIKNMLIKKIDIEEYSNNNIFSFTIIYSLDNLDEDKKEEENIFNLCKVIVEICGSFYYQPFLILLPKKKEEIPIFDKLIYEKIKKSGYDIRNISIFITPLNIDINMNQDIVKLIRKKIFTIFGYYFELGDEYREILINKDKYILPYKLYNESEKGLIDLNILILGKTQVGKSTFINTLLKKKRSKEGGVGFSITKSHLSYHVDDIPLILRDIEGFTGEENIKIVTDNIEKMQNSLGDNELNLVIYIIDFNGPTFFNDNEYSIFKQLTAKLDETQFLFVCLKSGLSNINKKVKNIKRSFYNMIQKGSEKISDEKNIMNVLNYLYLCQNKDILYEEIDKKSNSDSEQLSFFDKLSQNDEDIESKNKMMIDKILELDKTLFFANLIEDDEHKEIFGMNKISRAIRKSFKYLKKRNIKFLKNKINELNTKIEDKTNKKLNKSSQKFKECIETDNNELYENEKLLNKDYSSLISLKENQINYRELFKSIQEKNIDKTKFYAEMLKNQIIQSLKKDLTKEKIYGTLSGIFPLADIMIQYFIKKKAREKIAKKFNDNLIDFDGNKDSINAEERKLIEDIKNKSDHTTSNIVNVLTRIIAFSTNFVTKTFSVALGFVGIAIGIGLGGIFMNYDINSYLEFYGNRFLIRCLSSLSFNSIDKYFKDNFENNEDEDEDEDEDEYKEKEGCINEISEESIIGNVENILETKEEYNLFIIKNDELKFLPQIEIKFNNKQEITKDFISLFKKEIFNIIDNDNFSIIEIKKGSLQVILTLQFIIYKLINDYKNININQIESDIYNFSKKFNENIIKEVKIICEKLKNNNFMSLGSVKPNYLDMNIIDLKDGNNIKKLEEKIEKIAKEKNSFSDNIIINTENNINNIEEINDNEINIYEASKNITMKDLRKFYDDLSKKANEQEKNMRKLIERLDKFNEVFDIYFEKALKDSVFEYKIEYIFLVDKKMDKYLEEKDKCMNRIEQIVFHGTKLNSAILIVSDQFRDSRYHKIGKGVYFTDMLDYAWRYHKGDGSRETNIPKLGDYFSIVATDIYYDKNKIEVVYNNSTQSTPVQKFGVRNCYTDYRGTNLGKNVNNSGGLIWKEYLITDKDQILPLYSITLKRVEYLVIWRDFNFNSDNPNKYSEKIFKEIQEFHRKIKRKLVMEFESKIYYVDNTEEALELIKNKIYNKIIIVTNGYNDAEDYINNARRIIGANIIVGVSVYNVKRHIHWIKKMENTLLLNGIDYHEKFFKSIINNNINGLQNLKDEIINKYSMKIENFSLREFNDNILKYPKFKAKGSFGDLTNVINRANNESREKTCKII